MEQEQLLKPRQLKERRRGNLFPAAALGISLLGFLGFYMVPFLISAYYAFTDNPIQKNFVGFQNFIDLFENRFFLLGLKNTIWFMAIAIPLGMVLSLLLAIGIKKVNIFSGFLTLLFLIPLVMPSATIYRYWLQIYSGVLNGLHSLSGLAPVHQFSEWESRCFMVVIFIWKYMGYNIVLFQAGLYGIPEEYYQCASVLGAGAWQKFRHVTLVYLTPSFFIVFIMSFVNSFKIFREIYFVNGGYPAEGMYLLQHFMNSTLLSLSYQKLVSAVYILTLLVSVVVIAAFRIERRVSQNLVD